jgi:hypothetical protein
VAAGLLVAWMLEDKVLAQFYARPEHAPHRRDDGRLTTGLAIGAMVLFAFKRSERACRMTPSTRPKARATAFRARCAPAAEELEPAAAEIRRRGTKLRRVLAGERRISRTHVASGRPSLRPASSAYLGPALGRSRRASRSRRRTADAGHAQRGRVYIPDGRPFISFVTVERGDPAGHGVPPEQENPPAA